MKQKILWIAVALLLVFGIVGAGILYNYLGELYDAKDPLQSWGDGTSIPSPGGNSETPPGGNPVVPDGGGPTVPDEGDPTVPDEGDPAVPDEGDPTVPDEGDPTVPDEGDPGGDEPDPDGGDPATPPVGDKEPPATMTAPNFTVMDEHGNSVRLSDLVGKPIVLNFWATWCGYCRKEMPDFDRAARENPNVQFVMVNATDGVRETVKSAKQYIDQYDFAFDVYFDTGLEALSAYGVNAFPCTFFINAAGEVVVWRSGVLNYETVLRGISFIT